MSYIHVYTGRGLNYPQQISVQIDLSFKKDCQMLLVRAQHILARQLHTVSSVLLE